MIKGATSTYNRLKGQEKAPKTVFLCPPKVPCRIKDPNRLEGALLFSGHINRLTREGKDMRNQPELTASEVMGVDVYRNESQEREAKRYQDYAVSKFEEIYRNNRRICGLEAI